MATTTDILIIGAGPIGLELAAALKLLGADYLHLDARQIGHTMSWYPRQTRFFSSPDRLAVAGVPLVTVNQEKATGEQYLAYLRGIVEQFDLEVRSYEPVTSIRRAGERFVVQSERRQYDAARVVIAIGDMHRPRMLNIKGEDLPHVSHYFVEPHRYFRKRLLIIGGRNSAVEAAIRCQRAGANVSLSYRKEAFDTQSVKYWLTPEIEMLIKTGRVTYYPHTRPVCITAEHVELEPIDDTGADADQTPPQGLNPPSPQQVAADFVLLLVGYEMDMTLFEQLGIDLFGENQAPKLDRQTMQTQVPGLYVAGTAAAGTQVRFRLFIENCHAHVTKIIRHLTGQDPPFKAADKTHSGKYALPES